MWHGVNLRWWALGTLLLAAGLIAALAHEADAAPARSPGQDDIVISEFRTRGPNGSQDEFVELFNPAAAPIDVSGWKIMGSDNAGATTLLYEIPPSTSLAPGQHYLIVGATYSGSVAGETGATLSADIPNDGGIALTMADEAVIIDQIRMSSGSAYGEGALLAPLTEDLDQSHARVAGGCYDSNDNASDFTLSTPSAPQNTSSAVTVCDPATPAPTYTPIAPTHLVISEFRTRGPNGASDEFVELYNPTGAAVNIGGWAIRRSSGCGTTLNTLLIIASGTILQPGQHFLAVTSSNASISGAEQTFSPGIADEGGLALINTSGTIIDQVGMCMGTQYREGLHLPPLTGNLDQSYERKAGGDTSCYDTDNNAGDFALISPSNPQNRTNPFSQMCFGVVTYTPTNTPTRTGTSTPTVSRTPTRTRTPTTAPTSIPGVVVLNEFLPHPRSDWNADGTISTGDEYIEIINLGAQSINLKDWELDDFATVFVLPEMTLLPRQVAHFFGSETGISLSDGGDTLRLIKPDGNIADAFTYPVVGAADRTWCRLPDGLGTWGFSCRPTPGRLNTRLAGGGSGPGTGQEPGCRLADTVPQPVQMAECEPFGMGVWSGPGGPEMWLPGRWKWAVFVE